MSWEGCAPVHSGFLHQVQKIYISVLVLFVFCSMLLHIVLQRNYKCMLGFSISVRFWFLDALMFLSWKQKLVTTKDESRVVNISNNLPGGWSQL